MSQESVCFICQDSQNLIFTPCNHAACVDCIRRWLRIKNDCMICRRTFPEEFIRIYNPDLEYIENLYDEEDLPIIEENNNQIEYEVDMVIGHRGRGTWIEYRILWQDGTTTWEPRTNLNCPRLLNEYRRKLVIYRIRRDREREVETITID